MLGPVSGWWSGLNGSERLSSSQLSIVIHLTSLLPQDGPFLKPGPPPTPGIFQGTHALSQIRFSSWESGSMHLDPTCPLPRIPVLLFLLNVWCLSGPLYYTLTFLSLLLAPSNRMFFRLHKRLMLVAFLFTDSCSQSQKYVLHW